MQHEQCRHGRIARRRSRDRLHPGGLHRGSQHYDLILQLAGTGSVSDFRRALPPKGTLILNSGQSQGHWIGPLGRVIKARALSPFVSQRMVAFTVEPNKEDLEVLKQLIEAGTVTPVIGGTYSLSDVPEALRYLEEGRTRGKTVITM